jgi:hypothetical protein
MILLQVRELKFKGGDGRIEMQVQVDNESDFM